MAAQITPAPDPNIILKRKALLGRADATEAVESNFLGYYADGSDIAFRECNTGYVYASQNGYAGCCASSLYPDDCGIVTACRDSTMQWFGGSSVCSTQCFTQSIYEYYLNWQEGYTATFFACPHETGYPGYLYRTIEAFGEDYDGSASSTTPVKPASTVTVTVTATASRDAIIDGGDSSSGGGTNVGAIAGGVVGGVAGVALIAGLLTFFFLRRRKEKEMADIPEITLREQEQRMMP